jgi:hypothetical protein
MAPDTDTKDVHGRSRRTLLMVGGIASIAGTLVFAASALTMVCLWVALLFGSMGVLGMLLGVVTAPVAVAYPFLHWAARGHFPVFYFAIWLVGIVGMVTSMLWAVYGRQRMSRSPSRGRGAAARRAGVVDMPTTKRAVD